MGKSPSLFIPRPVELAGMRSRLLRAKQQAKDIAVTGKQYDEVMDGIDEAHRAVRMHVGDLKGVEYDLRSTITGMLERSNGDPTDGESDGRQSSSDEQEMETVSVKPDEQGAAEEVVEVAPDIKTVAEPAASWGAKT